ncbi:DUF6119 family protein [Conexibacter sp. CPCC 206217]|uniref:DUF6119 family protein n=1 Tax=Conexibacter sp. CPCC 206217 TaxID=3064574 RepID=UPI00272413BD|nr:DUF6119 family protein [Conexibacter sp. CPCC 206217]MDO8213985.1 TIGR04141 family sporadically distributed protein [Conexibacter sp. CPCC 206217]
MGGSKRISEYRRILKNGALAFAAMVRKRPVQKLTVSLLKDDCSRDDAFRDWDELEPFMVPALDPQQECLFIKARQPHPPRWTRYLAGHVQGPLEGLFAASAAAVLLFEAEGRLFAVTFGQGRHLLEQEAFEKDFGLKVVLNSVAPDQLKSVDAKTIDETPVHTRRDLSKDSSFSAFGLDPSRDLLRAVTGRPRDTELAHRLAGSDALTIHTREELTKLPELGARLLVAYGADDYKEHFEFIDFLRPVRDKLQVERLQVLLVDALRGRDWTDVHLAAPETIDWQEFDGFRFSTQASDDSANDPSIRTYIATRDEDVALDVLKHDRLAALRASDGEVMASWPIYRCIVFQTELDGFLYVLSDGDWFRVDLDYRTRLEAEVRALPLFHGMPDAAPGSNEDAYNLEAARAMGAVCLDKRFVYDGGPDKMEICDLLTRDGALIHVKHRGSSATLSHLFSQGVNSAERLLTDEDFRKKAATVIQRESNGNGPSWPLHRPRPEDYEIVFAVITRSTRRTPLTLPFFSVVSLRAAAKTLQGFGFKVSTVAVREC